MLVHILNFMDKIILVNKYEFEVAKILGNSTIKFSISFRGCAGANFHRGIIIRKQRHRSRGLTSPPHFLIPVRDSTYYLYLLYTLTFLDPAAYKWVFSLLLYIFLGITLWDIISCPLKLTTSEDMGHIGSWVAFTPIMLQLEAKDFNTNVFLRHSVNFKNEPGWNI